MKLSEKKHAKTDKTIKKNKTKHKIFKKTHYKQHVLLTSGRKHKKSTRSSGKVRGSSGSELFHDLPGKLKTLNPFLFNKTQSK